MATAVQTPNIGNAEVGEAQRLFAEQAAAREAEMIESGQCVPFSIANFNPVELGLQGVLKQYKVPTPFDKRLPDALRFTMEYEGKTFKAHTLTIRHPKKDGKMTGATSTGSPGEVIAQREPKLYLPKEIAYSFMEHFSPVFTARTGTVLPPAPKDARRIYGLLVYEGDLHTLENLLNEDDPAKRIIRVPVCHVQTVGKTSIKSFRTVEFSLDDYLEQMFVGQRRYADAVITRAQQKWNGTDEDRKDISDSDRVWYRWAIELGYAQKPAKGEKTWLNEYLTLVGDGGDSKPDNRRKCQACKAVEPELNTPFCPKCAAPINTFKTFMDGFPVPEAWLQTLRGEEREVVLAEVRMRKQGFGDSPMPAVLQPFTERDAPVPVLAPETLAKFNRAELTNYAVNGCGIPEASLKGLSNPEIIAVIEKAAWASADEIPAAASTALPGEEE